LLAIHIGQRVELRREAARLGRLGVLALELLEPLARLAEPLLVELLDDLVPVLGGLAIVERRLVRSNSRPAVNYSFDALPLLIN
jgi:hypothetical protein